MLRMLLKFAIIFQSKLSEKAFKVIPNYLFYIIMIKLSINVIIFFLMYPELASLL